MPETNETPNGGPAETLPAPLQAAIDDALAFVRRDPSHDLNPGYRTAIYRALGPRLDSENPHEAHHLAGYRRRAALELFTVRQMLPYWKYIYPAENEDLAGDLVREAEDVLDHPAIWQTVRHQSSQTGAYLEHISVHASWDGFDLVTWISRIGQAASTAHATALFDMDDLDETAPIDYDLTNNDFDPFSSDAASLIMSSYCGTGGTHEYAFELARRWEFWEWWLTVAVPHAWALVAEDGQLAPNWKEPVPPADVLFLSNRFRHPKTLVILPPSLRQQIEAAVRVVRADPRHDLPADLRRDLYAELDLPPDHTAATSPNTTTTHAFTADRIGAIRRAILAFFPVANMETIWINWPPVGGLPRRLLLDLERVLAGTLPWPDALAELESRWRTLTTLLDEQRRGDEGGTPIALAACAALREAIRAVADPSALASLPPSAVHDEDLALATAHSGACDPARLVALAYTAYGGAEEAIQSTKRRDYWLWWLTQALPAAWAAIDDAGHLHNEWRPLR